MNKEFAETTKLDSVAKDQSESKSWPAERLWDLRFCARHRLPLHKAASFLGRTETEVREKAAECLLDTKK